MDADQFFNRIITKKFKRSPNGTLITTKRQLDYTSLRQLDTKNILLQPNPHGHIYTGLHMNT